MKFIRNLIILAVVVVLFMMFSPVLVDEVLYPEISQTCLDAGWDTSYVIGGEVYCGPDHGDGTGTIWMVSEESVLAIELFDAGALP